jgi:hypothetical protein
VADEVVRFDRAEFDRISSKRQDERTRTRRPELERLAQAEPAAKLLTDSEPWNQALSLMEAKALALEEKCAELRENLETVIQSDPNAVWFMQTQLLVARATLDQLREIMEMPEKMKKTGQDAARLLKDMGAPSEEAS